MDLNLGTYNANYEKDFPSNALFILQFSWMICIFCFILLYILELWHQINT